MNDICIVDKQDSILSIYFLEKLLEKSMKKTNIIFYTINIEYYTLFNYLN